MKECEWLQEIRDSGQAPTSPIILAKEARLEMEKKQLISTDRMNRILTPIDKYVQVVDVAIEHSPEIAYVYGIDP